VRCRPFPGLVLADRLRNLFRCRILRAMRRTSRRLFGHSCRARILASMLLAGVLGTTCVPVCGSTGDVVAAKCCERQGCRPAAEKFSHACRASETAPHRDVCSATENSPAPRESPDQCCNRARLTYPVAKVQPFAVAPHHAALAAGVNVMPLVSRANLWAEASSTLSSFKFLFRSLYDLTSAYRI